MAVKCHSVRFNRRVLICGTLPSQLGAKPPTAREGRHDWSIVEYQYRLLYNVYCVKEHQYTLLYNVYQKKEGRKIFVQHIWFRM